MAGKLTRSQQAGPAQAERGEGQRHAAAVRAATQKLAPWVMDDDSLSAMGLAPPETETEAAAGESASTSAEGPESAEGTEGPKGAEGPEAMWRQVIGERSTAVGTFARVRAPKGVRLRKGPSAAHPDLGVLPFDDLVTVERRTEHGWCWIISAGSLSGSAGFCEEQFLAMDPPEPTAHLYRVAPGDSLREIAERAYGKSFGEGRDARLYVQALYEANKNHKGIYLTEVELSAKDSLVRGSEEEQTVEIYKGAKVREGHSLWIPSEAFIDQLRAAGAITGGTSTPKQLWRGAKAGVGHAIDGARYGSAFLIGILEGSWSAIVDLFKGAAEMIQLVGKTVYELITGDLGAIKDMLLGWVEKLELAWAQRGAMAADFMAKWESDDAWTRGNFQGEVLGWVMMTALLILATAGEAAVVLATGKWATVLRILRTADALGDVTTYVGKAARLPREAASVIRSRLGKGLEEVGEVADVAGVAGDTGAKAVREGGQLADGVAASPTFHSISSSGEQPARAGGGKFGVDSDSGVDLLTDPRPPPEVLEVRSRLTAGESLRKYDATQAFRKLVREMLTRRAQEVDAVGNELKRVGGAGFENVSRSQLQEAFDYLFRSNGIELGYANYAAWRRVSVGSSTVDDLRFLKHELEELKVLRAGGLKDPTGLSISAGALEDWQRAFFTDHYLPAHRRALDAELTWLSREISGRTRGRLNLSTEELAMSDPTRREARDYALRDGIPISKHALADRWDRGSEVVEFPADIAKALGLPMTVKIEDVIRAVKSASARNVK